MITMLRRQLPRCVAALMATALMAAAALALGLPRSSHASARNGIAQNGVIHGDARPDGRGTHPDGIEGSG